MATYSVKVYRSPAGRRLSDVRVFPFFDDYKSAYRLAERVFLASCAGRLRLVDDVVIVRVRIWRGQVYERVVGKSFDWSGGGRNGISSLMDTSSRISAAALLGSNWAFLDSISGD